MSQSIAPSHPVLALGQQVPMGGSNKPVHAFNIVPTPGAGSLYPVVGQPYTQSPSTPTPGETLPARGSNTPCARPTPPTRPEMNRASRMRIILDCRDASTVPSVLDLLTLMDQDHPTPDQSYVNALSEFYDFGVEDILDVFDLPCGLLASLGDLGSDRAYQLHEYVRDKLLLPLGLLETGLKAVVGGEDRDEDPVVKEGGNSSVIKIGSQSSVVKAEGDSSIVEVASRQRSIIKGEEDSVVEVEGRRSIAGVGGDSSIIEMAAAQTLPQAPAADRESMEYSDDKDEGWLEEDSWIIKEECEERVLEWLAEVREAGENEENESDVSHEV